MTQGRTFTLTKSRAIILAFLCGGDPTDYFFTAPHINIKQVKAWKNVCARPRHLHSKKRRLCVAAHWSSIKEQRAANRILEDGVNTPALPRTQPCSRDIPTCYVGLCTMPTRLQLAPGCKHIAEQLVLVQGQLREQMRKTHQSLLHPSRHICS